jgi:hypothetical protein
MIDLRPSRPPPQRRCETGAAMTWWEWTLIGWIGPAALLGACLSVCVWADRRQGARLAKEIRQFLKSLHVSNPLSPMDGPAREDRQPQERT